MKNEPGWSWRLGAMVLALAVVSGTTTWAQEEKSEKTDEVDVQALMTQGQMALGSQDWARAAAAFGKVVQADEDNGQAWHLRGYALHLDGQLDEAIKCHTRAATFEQVRALSLFNLGCAHSLKGNVKESISFLHKAMDAGFDRFEMLEEDADLDKVREAPGFQAILRRARNGGKRPPSVNLKRLVGAWQVTEGNRAGEAVAAERLPQISITEKTITIPAGDTAFVMEYKIDTTQRPATIDMKVTSGPAPEDSKALGLIRMQGNKLVLCYHPLGGQRPEKFTATAENECYLFVAQRVEKEPAAKGDDGDEDDDDDDDDGR